MRRLATDFPDEATVIHEQKARLDASFATAPTHVYQWGNNSRRAELKGRACHIVARGAKGTILVEFADTGERVTTSHRAVRAI